jgi:hypothetical protein
MRHWVAFGCFLAGLAVAVFALYAAGALGSGSGLGCRLSSVDEDEFVAANREMLKEIPVYPGSTLMYESSNGWAVAQDRCFPFENSGPYDSYGTFVRYKMPTRTTFAEVDAFYRRELGARGWVLESYGGLERGYKRGEASLSVRSALGESFWEFVAVHKYR